MSLWFVLTAIALAGLADLCVGDRVEIMLLQLTATTPDELTGRDPSCTYTILLSLPNTLPISACKTNQDLKSGTAVYNLPIYVNEDVTIARTALLTANFSLDCSEQNCPENLRGDDCKYEESCAGFGDTGRQFTAGNTFAFSRNVPVDRVVTLTNYAVSFRLIWTGPTDPPTVAPTPFSTLPRSSASSSSSSSAMATPSHVSSTVATGIIATSVTLESLSSSHSSTDAVDADSPAANNDDTGSIIGIAIGAGACILFVVVGAVVLALRSKRNSDDIKAVAVKNTSYIFDSAREDTPIPDAPVVSPTLRTNDYAVSFATFSEDAAVRDDGAYRAPLDRKPTVSESEQDRSSAESSRYASARRPTGYAPATQLTQSLNKPAF
jgi:hypothetical protein